MSLRAAAAFGGATGGGGPAPFAGYISGNWYKPYLDYSSSAGAAASNTALYLALIYMPADVVITALGSRVATASPGNFMLGLYAHNTTTGFPTGNVLASVTGLSTAAAASVSSTLGASVPLTRGFYWTATETDNATAALYTPASSAINRYSVIGVTAQSDLNDSGYRGVQVTNTYGSFPDLTAGSFTSSTNDHSALFNYRVA